MSTSTREPDFGVADDCGASRRDRRPDVRSKIDGSFEYSNDVHIEGMLFGATVRSRHPHARLVSPMPPLVSDPAVVCVLTMADVATTARTGHIQPDQTPFVDEVARYVGEPVAFVVATSQDAAWRIADDIERTLEWEPLEVVGDPELALRSDAVLVHPDGNLIRELVLRRGALEEFHAAVVVEGVWETGRQDQAFLGVESAVAWPDTDGGVSLKLATQDLHTDQHQIAAVLGLPLEMVRLEMSGIGGAFGGREDITCQVHLALAALTTGRPVATTYRRDESFLAHPKRHPSRWKYRLGADAEGTFRFLEVDVVLDGGPYASTSGPVLGSACYFSAGPYRIPAVSVRGRVARTNNPVSGAMRGFGAVQACFAMESTVDLLARELGLDPIEIRRRNVLGPGDLFPTSGQLVTDPVPLTELIERCVELPVPEPTHDPHPLAHPGGTGLSVGWRSSRRGQGFALGVKNHLYGEGTPEWSEAEMIATSTGIVLRSAAAEVGQGIWGVLETVARDELGEMAITRASSTAADGYAGSSSASRQTWMSGAAVHGAARELAQRLRARAAERWGVEVCDVAVTSRGLQAVTEAGVMVMSLEDLLGDDIEMVRYRYDAPPTESGENGTGQGDVHVSWMFVAQRAIVDVDLELGLCRVVEVATAQDVGRVLDRVEVEGQVRGAVVQGIGLALTEELASVDGLVMNNSFTDYLIPTAADVPRLPVRLVEHPDPRSPLGVKGVGEPGSLASTAAIAAALRDATQRRVPRVPVRPEDLISDN